MRLILFSGGVESTALLTVARPTDIALTLTSPLAIPHFRIEDAEAIVRHFDLERAFARHEIPGRQFSHQMLAFVGVCAQYVDRNPGITEVWCGRNSAEPRAGLKPFIDRMMAAWQLLQPDVPFLHPLDHLSKREQWEMIPNEIRHLVGSCEVSRMCGRCPKCREWLCLSQNSPDATPV